MKPLVTKIVLALVLPGVGWFVLYQIDPKLVDPSSEKSLFAMIMTVKKAGTAVGDLSKSDSPAQLLSIIRQTLSGGDSLLAQDQGQRDPMKPLIALDAAVFRPDRQIERPAVEERFPVSPNEVSGIFWIPGSPQVVVQGQRYKTGGEIKGAKITVIEQRAVTFEWQGKVFRIEVGKAKIN